MADNVVLQSMREVFEAIRDERNVSANTATRIGNAFLSIVSFLENEDQLYLRTDTGGTVQAVVTLLKGLILGTDGHQISETGSAILDLIQSLDYTSNQKGFLLKTDESGYSTLEIDELFVRKIAILISLAIKEIKHIGGQLILSPASMTCSEVEETDDAYRCYFRNEDQNGNEIYQEFEVDDLAIRQTFSLKSGTTDPNAYYWRRVIAAGANYIDLSKTDCATGSKVPQAGDEIVQLGNVSNTSRQNATILSTVGDDAPSFKQYKGINSYELPDDKAKTLLSPSGNKITGDFITTSGENIEEKINALGADWDAVKEQVDQEYTLWFFEYEPTLENVPASDWTDDETKETHVEDIFYNRDSGKAYRFVVDDSGTYSWTEITDAETVRALEKASTAQDTADSKRRVFVGQPYTPYDVGDQWAGASYSDEEVSYDNDLLVCTTARTEGEEFSILDWVPATAATAASLQVLSKNILATVTSNKEELESQIADVSTVVDNFKSQYATESIKQSEQNAVYDSYLTMIEANTEGLTAVSARITNTIDESGNLTTSAIEAAGLVTESDFAGLVASYTDAEGNPLVTTASLSVYITEKDFDSLLSVAKIKADQITFEGYTIINGNFSVDEQGNATMKNANVTGTINADRGYFGFLQIKESGDIRADGDVGFLIYATDSDGESANDVASIEMGHFVGNTFGAFSLEGNAARFTGHNGYTGLRADSEGGTNNVGIICRGLSDDTTSEQSVGIYALGMGGLRAYGVYAEASYGTYNWGLWSPQGCCASAFIGKYCQNITVTGPYDYLNGLVDLTSYNVFVLTTSDSTEAVVTLPYNTIYSVFNLSYGSLPSNLYIVFTFIIGYGSAKITLEPVLGSIIDNNGNDIGTLAMEVGDVVTMAAMVWNGGFIFKILNRYQ